MPRIATLALCLGVSFAAPALAQSKATIQQLNDKWAAAFNKGDAAAVAAMYAEDAYVLPPGGEMVKGRSAIEAFWKETAQHVGDAKLVTVDVLPLGRRGAREIGTVTPRNQSPAAAAARRQIRGRVAQDPRKMAAGDRYLELEQVKSAVSAEGGLGGGKLHGKELSGRGDRRRRHRARGHARGDRRDGTSGARLRL